MANRKEYRKVYKREKNKYVSEEENSIKSFIIIIIVVLIVFGIVYLLTVGAKNLGLFDEGYNKPVIKPAEISYSYITSGTVFTRNESSYYVLIVDTEDNDSIYLSSLISSYEENEEHLAMYIVDLNEGFNKNIKGEEDNPEAQSSDELKVSKYALIKIEDGENVQYLTTLEDIEEELK